MSPFKPVQRVSLATLVYEQVRDQILAGDVAAGESLPSERVLSEMLQVNRGAVREGLKQLEHSGLVRIHQGGATRVLDYRSSAGLDLLGPMLLASDGRMVVTVARSLLEMRAAILPPIARLSASRGGRDIGTELSGIVGQMKAHKGDLERLRHLSFEFWQTTVRGSENVAFQFTFNRLRPPLTTLMKEIVNAFAGELKAVRDYQALATAVNKGNPPDAASAAKKLLRKGTAAAELALTALDDFATEEFGEPF